MTNRLIKFEQGEAVYASATNPDLDFSDFVGIDLGSGQTASLGQIVLPVDVSIGRSEITVGKDRYRLVINSVRIKLDKTNASYITGTRYGAKPPAIEGKTELKDENKKHSKGGFSLDGKLGLQGVELKVGGTLERQSDALSSTNQEATMEYALAYPEGAHSIRVEMPDGARGGLTNMVLSSRNADGDLTPYCHLQAADAHIPVTGRIRVQARPAAIELQKISKGRGRSLRVTDGGLRSSKAALQRAQAEADDLLREKLAGLALIMPLLSTDSGQHIDLAMRGFAFYPQQDDDDG